LVVGAAEKRSDPVLARGSSVAAVSVGTGEGRTEEEASRLKRERVFG